VIDGEEQPLSLMKLVKATQDASQPNNSLIAFHDNSSAIVGFPVPVFKPSVPNGPAKMDVVDGTTRHITLTAETHNFPTGIAPFPGATTGTGGRLRDNQSTGQGAHVIAGTAGCVRIPQALEWWQQFPLPFLEPFVTSRAHSTSRDVCASCPPFSFIPPPPPPPATHDSLSPVVLPGWNCKHVVAADGRALLSATCVLGCRYCVGNLHIPGYELPWEDTSFSYPSTMATPLQIAVEAGCGPQFGRAVPHISAMACEGGLNERSTHVDGNCPVPINLLRWTGTPLRRIPAESSLA
jgi:hypothetical protein